MKTCLSVLMRVGVRFALIALISLSNCAAQDLQTKLKGKSSCTPELRKGRFSIRLDKTQHAFIVASTVDGQPSASIVQYSSESEQCGIIRDVVQTSRKSVYFEVECNAPTAPTDVVIATRPLRESARKGYSNEAWRVDLKQLRFLRVEGRAYCIPSNYQGDDDGEDLAMWARQRTKKH